MLEMTENLGIDKSNLNVCMYVYVCMYVLVLYVY